MFHLWFLRNIRHSIKKPQRRGSVSGGLAKDLIRADVASWLPIVLDVQGGKKGGCLRIGWIPDCAARFFNKNPVQCVISLVTYRQAATKQA